jgi:hypothetical protein
MQSDEERTLWNIHKLRSAPGHQFIDLNAIESMCGFDPRAHVGALVESGDVEQIEGGGGPDAYNITPTGTERLRRVGFLEGYKVAARGRWVESQAIMPGHQVSDGGQPVPYGPWHAVEEGAALTVCGRSLDTDGLRCFSEIEWASALLSQSCEECRQTTGAP